MLIFNLALRNVLRNRRRSLLTILSMGGGYFLLSLSLSMSEGSYNHMIDLFTRDHTGHVQLHYQDYLQRPSLYKVIDDVDEIIGVMQSQPEVQGVAPRIYGPSLAYGKNKTFPANVVGFDPLLEPTATRLKDKVKQGVYLAEHGDADPAGVMLGVSLAKNLKLTVGDELVLISQGIDGSIANDVFDVKAIVGTAESFERMNVYMRLADMRDFLSMSDGVHELAISLQHQGQALTFSNRLQQELNERQLSVDPWQVVESSFFKSMQADKKGNYISLGIIIFIVSISVLNTVLMGTLERTREFGVLRAIGTQPSMVFSLILLESFLLSLSSCIVGLLFSIPANYWLITVGYTIPEPIDMGGIYFETMLGEMSWFTLGLPALVVIASTLIVSLFPGIRAARISPLKALQAV